MPLRNPHVIALLLALACVTPAAAEQANPGDCLGVDFDAKRPLVVAKVVASPRAQFVLSRWENESCPADTVKCRSSAYLVPGDLALTSATLGPYTCVAYQSPRDTKQKWTNGWMATVALE